MNKNLCVSDWASCCWFSMVTLFERCRFSYPSPSFHVLLRLVSCFIQLVSFLVLGDLDQVLADAGVTEADWNSFVDVAAKGARVVSACLARTRSYQHASACSHVSSCYSSTLLYCHVHIIAAGDEYGDPVLSALLGGSVTDMDATVFATQPAVAFDLELTRPFGDLGKLVVEVGYACCSSVTAARELLDNFDTRDLGPGAIARCLGKACMRGLWATALCGGSGSVDGGVGAFERERGQRLDLKAAPIHSLEKWQKRYTVEGHHEHSPLSLSPLFIYCFLSCICTQAPWLARTMVLRRTCRCRRCRRLLRGTRAASRHSRRAAPGLWKTWSTLSTNG